MLISLAVLGVAHAEDQATNGAVRERLLMDFNWRFAFGHAREPGKDFDPAGNYFSYYAKAGNGAGAAAVDFDDRGWRLLDLPHDWAVEVPFDRAGSASHGYKAIGRNFPATSVGWYRKTFFIPASDAGRRISVEFDGVFRDSTVWVNGFYLGREASGYTGFNYDLTSVLNYGGENVIAVRADASLEEGWFYEGAGIYRHVWLEKTAPLHVADHGTFVSSEVTNNLATITARVTVNNDDTNSVPFEIEQTILDANGQPLASGVSKSLSLAAGTPGEFSSSLTVTNPALWSCESPYLHKLVTTIRTENAVVDRYETSFGIRTVRWDANEGFFLNGKHVELKGTCDHEDHAGVGAAVPDELNMFRLTQLKKMGSNAIRTSHNPPTPELLDACDRLGLLVMDENRRMGASLEVLSELESFIRRDRNHPSVIIWSLGNEEWNLEGNERGRRITEAMQSLVQRLDPTRRVTSAISGGWGYGASTIVDVMGLNYFSHGSEDQFHAKFPGKPMVATEEASTFSTRGIYVTDRDHQHLSAYDVNKPDWGELAEPAWTHYVERPYIAGTFQWTGFDYRGEETPFGWPAISSQFGIMDVCGFPKDNFYYYQAWWSDAPVLHLFPHWNWPGREGEDIDVWVQSNCEEVELFLNGQSQGRKKMPRNSHLEWKVKYAPGTLLARGFNGGKEILADQRETTGAPAAIQLTPHRENLRADREDVSVITTQVNDAQGRLVPNATNEITFSITGPGRIIGVGNGDPSSHEPDKFVETTSALPLENWRMKTVESLTNRPEMAFEVDDSNWQTVSFKPGDGRGNRNQNAQPLVYRASFERPANAGDAALTLVWRATGDEESVCLNGRPLAHGANWNDGNVAFELPPENLRDGKNIIAVALKNSRDSRRNPITGEPGLVCVTKPCGPWKRSLFSGLAQVIVQSTGEPGQIVLTAHSPQVADGVLKLKAVAVSVRPFVQ
ncbi:MAG TPA: beta-galactosidase GalA [Verrucomicrobiae bacterium]|nr:beta-galactosidase GalA [Verrucomicrobiae bacterium]